MRALRRECLGGCRQSIGDVKGEARWRGAVPPPRMPAHSTCARYSRAIRLWVGAGFGPPPCAKTFFNIGRKQKQIIRCARGGCVPCVSERPIPLAHVLCVGTRRSTVRVIEPGPVPHGYEKIKRRRGEEPDQEARGLAVLLR